MQQLLLQAIRIFSHNSERKHWSLISYLPENSS